MKASHRPSRARTGRLTTNVVCACLLLAGSLPVLSCGGGDNHPLCQSVFHSKSSPTTVVVIANGTFATGESILLTVPINGETQTFVGTTSPDGMHATFTGIPSGHYDHVNWVASCKDGELTLFSNGTLDVM